ncbi:MAG TPA: hypothetical protein VIT44_06985 [Cyclobacteriaceae bacterium]
MLAEFSRLSNVEVELLLKAPILTSILIAGADGNIDRKEIDQAITVARKNARRSKARLMEFYQFVGEDFEDKLKVVIQSYPHNAGQRNAMIVQELAQLNHVLPKVDLNFAKALYGSIKDIAQKIAESSGGLLGIKSVGQEEAQYVNLPMIKDPATY